MEGQLPAGWTEHVSSRTGRRYYFHAATNNTQWFRPGLPIISPNTNQAAQVDVVHGAVAVATSITDAASAEPHQKKRKVEQAAGSASAAMVASAYDAQPEQAKEVRARSKIKYLRGFQNWVKSVLIDSSVPKPCQRVLDLACGKLGDLEKWKKAGVTRYVGVDISKQQVLRAVDRFNEANSGARSKIHARLVQADLGECDLAASPAVQQDEQFDVVSIQFALHYLFQSESTALRFFRNLAGRLAPGGAFVGTMIDADVVVRLLREEHASQRRKGAPADPADKDPFRVLSTLRNSQAVGGSAAAPAGDTAAGLHAGLTESQRTALFLDQGVALPIRAPPSSLANSNNRPPASSASASASAGRLLESLPDSGAGTGDGSVLGSGSGSGAGSRELEGAREEEMMLAGGSAVGAANDASLTEVKVGNSLYSITMGRRDLARQYALGQNPFGCGYDFFLTESVDCVREYLCPPQLLQRLCRSCGLVMEINENFHEFYARHSGAGSRYRKLLGMMRVHDEDGQLSKDEWEVAGLYRAFCFRRDTGLPVSIRPSKQMLDPLRVPQLKEREYVFPDQVLSLRADGSWQGGGVEAFDSSMRAEEVNEDEDEEEDADIGDGGRINISMDGTDGAGSRDDVQGLSKDETPIHAQTAELSAPLQLQIERSGAGPSIGLSSSNPPVEDGPLDAGSGHSQGTQPSMQALVPRQEQLDMSDEAPGEGQGKMGVDEGQGEGQGVGNRDREGHGGALQGSGVVGVDAAGLSAFDESDAFPASGDAAVFSASSFAGEAVTQSGLEAGSAVATGGNGQMYSYQAGGVDGQDDDDEDMFETV